MPERRQSDRIECSIPAIVYAPDEQGLFFEEATMVENYSPSGACLRLSRRLRRGTLIVVADPHQDHEGTAQVCLVWQDEQQNNHKIGVRFLNPDENWLPGKDTPSL